MLNALPLPLPPCCSAETAPHLSSEEVQAALDVLDTDRSGSIDFTEWVAWWVAKAGTVKVSQAS